MERMRGRCWLIVGMIGVLSALICLVGGAEAVPIQWSAVAALPLPRHSGATVVVNGLIYVIGGIEYGNSMTVYGQSYDVTTGAVVEAYDPATDAWTAKAPLPYPVNLMTRKAEGRQWLAAAAYNGKIYTFGGANIYGEVRDTIDIYDVATDTWTVGIARLPRPTVGLAATAFGEAIYLFGGSTSTDMFAAQNYLGTCYAFHPKTGEILEIAPMPGARFKTSAMPYNDGILVLGGISARGSGSAQWYDPATDTWTNLEPVNWERRFWGAAAVEEQMFLVGGRDEHALSSGTVDVYLSEHEAWVAGTPMGVAREDAFVASVDGVLYVFGGLNHDQIPFADAERGAVNLAEATYTPQEPEAPQIVIDWAQRAPMPTPRYYGATALVDNVIYTIGGLEGQDPTGRVVEAYDPGSDTWTTKTPLPEGRFNVAATAFEEKIYVFGGADVAGNVVDTVDRYDPVTDTWEKAITRLPQPAAGVAVTVYEDRMYLFGGSRSSQMFVPAENYYNNVYAFDPETLTFEALPAMPVARNMATAGVIDDEIFVIGGMKSPGATANQCYRPKHRPTTAQRWVLRAEMPLPHGGHVGVTIATMRTSAIFVLGGANTADIYTYVYPGDYWVKAKSLPAPRNMAFVGLAKASPESIYLIGGADQTGTVVGTVFKGTIDEETLP
ncbi:MAG TPA: kelch repeat-containing protein [Candidatus Heimdallarchaeota archaeon]|nr:kelch repeat-containing protein [Candidatus Heimdallarchaeota archaeon]